jgi:hypothetical protein
MIVARPLTIAEIFDRTVTLTVQRWRPIVVLALLGSIPSVLARVATRGQDPSGPALAAYLVCTLAVGALIYPASIRAFADDVEPSSIAALLRRAAPDVGRSLLLFVLIDAVLFVPFFAFALIVAVAYIIGHLAGAVLAGVVLGVPTLIALPGLYAILTIVYPMMILEGTGVWRSLRNAWRRGAQGGGFARTWLLGAAVLFAVCTPAIAVDAGLKQLATVLGGLWWLTLPGTLLASLIGTGFGMGLSTIAAIDYRLRAEGTDLHAALEMPAPA